MYRLLDVGEDVKPGDELYRPEDGWIKFYGYKIGVTVKEDNLPIRRKIKSLVEGQKPTTNNKSMPCLHCEKFPNGAEPAEICPTCNGLGGLLDAGPRTGERCTTCGGSGKLRHC